MHISDTDLGAFLADAGMISDRDLAAAKSGASEAKRPLGDYLVMRGSISAADLARSQAHMLGLPFVGLVEAKPDLETLSLIPEPLARNLNAVAYKREGDDVFVAALDPRAFAELSFLDRGRGFSIVPKLTDPESVKSLLVRYQRLLGERFGDAVRRDADALPRGSTSSLKAAELVERAEDAAVTQLFDTLLSHALLQGASSVHLDPEEHALAVRYRVNGRLLDAMVLPRQAAEHLVMRAKRLSGLDLSSSRVAEGGFKMDTGAESAVVRLSTSPAAFGEKAVLRLERDLSSSASRAGFSLEALGLRGRTLEDLYGALHCGHGLILATGPAGSGKTTFLYTLADLLNHPSKSLVSIEEEPEYALKRVSQVAVRPEAGFGYAEGVRAAMRGEPDALVVADVRDAETARLVVSAALRGAVVLAGVVARDAADAVAKLLSFGVDPGMLSSTLSASAGMRVVPKLGENREKYFLSRDEVRSLGKLVSLDRLSSMLEADGMALPGSLLENAPFLKPRAGQWKDSAYAGQLGLYEVLSATPRMRELVSDGAKASVLHDEALRAGMETLLEDGVRKALLGQVSLEDILRAAPSRL